LKENLAKNCGVTRKNEGAPSFTVARFGQRIVAGAVVPDVLLGDVKIRFRRQLHSLDFQFAMKSFRADFGAILKFQTSWREIRRGNLNGELAALAGMINNMKAILPKT
jgi:hypothetical protein